MRKCTALSLTFLVLIFGLGVSVSSAEVAVVFQDNMESGPGGWFAQAPWELTTSTSNSSTHSWTDSPGGNYSNDTNKSLFSPFLNFQGFSSVSLTFWHRYDLEDTFDFGNVYVTTNNGPPFTKVASFTGTNNTWTQATINLSAFAGQPSVRIVFQLLSDSFVTRDGWYIDDVIVTEPGATEADDVFVSSFADGDVYKIDSGTGNKVIVASGLSSPEDMVIDSTGILYIGGVFTGVKRFDTKTNTFLSDVGTNICGPEGPSIDANGDLFVNTRRSPCSHSGVWKIAGRTAAIAVQVVPPFSTWGEGTAFLKFGPFAGHLIASDAEGPRAGRIVRSAPPNFGGPIDFITGLSTPVGIAVNPSDGDVFVVEQNLGEILRYDSSGAFKSVFAQGLTGSVGFLEFDNAGNLYVADEGSSSLLKFTPAGIKTILASGIPEITGVAIARGFLSFPLQVFCGGQVRCTPFSAKVSAVQDHHLVSGTGVNGTGYNCNLSNDCADTNGVYEVLAFNGEKGIKSTAGDANCSPPGYKNVAATPFLVGVINYVGATCPGIPEADNKLYLNYDGHSGYDYPYLADTTPIIAPADGDLFKATTDIINAGSPTAWDRWHTFYIDHHNGLTTWYLHANSLGQGIDDEIGNDFTKSVPVARGQVIAYVGGFGGVPDHLHFEVRRGLNQVVDPYLEGLWTRTVSVLSVAKAGLGNGQVTSDPAGVDCGDDCREVYKTGTSVTLTATPASGSVFSGWSGDPDCSDGVVTMNADKTCTATFIRQFTLTVTKAGTGSGTVTSSPAGVNCGTDCTETYDSGKIVTLSASSAIGSTFTGWSGGGCSGIGTCMLTLNGDTTVFATFSLVITVRAPNGGEIWRRGTKQTIRWTYTGNPGSNVKVELLKGGVLNKVISSNAAIGSGGNGSLIWTVPKKQVLGSDYKIRVTSTSNSTYTDTSNANFTISK